MSNTAKTEEAGPCNSENKEEAKEQGKQVSMKTEAVGYPNVIPAEALQDSDTPRNAPDVSTGAAEASDHFDILDVVKARAADIHSDDLIKEEYKAKNMSKGTEVNTKPTQQEFVHKSTDSAADLKQDTKASVELLQQRLSLSSQGLDGSQPGAYTGAPGESLSRREDIRFSIVGRPQPGEIVDDPDNMQEYEDDPIPLPSTAPVAATHFNNSQEQGDFWPSPGNTGSNDRGPLGNGLAEAMPVDNISLPDMEAQPFDIEASQQKKVERTKKHLQPLLIFAFLLVLVVAAVISAFLLGKKEKESDNPITATPFLSPSPSQSPSFDPTGSLDSMMLNLAPDTLENLNTFGTPQRMAMDWLGNHPSLSTMEEWRKTQMFALVAFYFAMEGPNWPEKISKEWLLYDKPACLWFSTALGEFNEEGEWVPFEYYVEKSPVCSDRNELHILDLGELGLEKHAPTIPPEISLLTSLLAITLLGNDIGAVLEDFLPSQIYMMSNLLSLNLLSNALAGAIPTEVGLMANLEALQLQKNMLNGSIPTELGMSTTLEVVMISENDLSGSIPSELGRMSSLSYLWINKNNITGAIPSQIWLLSSLEDLDLSVNNLSGPLPSEIALMTSIQRLNLNNNTLKGNIPTELRMLNTTILKTMTLANNFLSGSIPENLCVLGKYEPLWTLGLSFDCSDRLCGCCWCPCPGSSYSSECASVPYVPSRDDGAWPGAFPTPLNRSNAIAINVLTDDFPAEISLEWSQLRESEEWWEVLDTIRPSNISSLHSYTQAVDCDAFYRLQILDSYGDGTCCGNGFGWFTITNSTPSTGYDNGSVVWEAAGYDLENSLDVLMWVDANGHAQQVSGIPGQEILPLGVSLIKDAGEDTPDASTSSLIVIPNETVLP